MKTTKSQIWFTYYGIIYFRKNDRVSDLVQLYWRKKLRKKIECQIFPDITIHRASSLSCALNPQRV